ncbi:hypothetical protein SCG7109_BH_00060 [Chlamydiales bacterium SCGC AG-110-M15]|nr:hypothetical protein SCG7109_BH_00060 [Chlamydiales bacterium SCGC AG-110-M15]
MLLKDDTKNTQSKLANYCRSGYYDPIPGVRPERAKVYRRLVYNLMEGALSSAYPITRQVLTDDEWVDFVQHFLTQHDCQSPHLWCMPKGLWEFAVKEQYAKKLGKPYLEELLCFEWLEIEMDMMPDIDPGPYESDGDPLNSPLLLNPHNQVRTFTYPVFSRSIEDLEKHHSQYHLLLFRHQEHHEVRYVALSPLYATLVSILQNKALSAKVALEHVAKYFNLVDDATLFTEGQHFIEMLIKEGAILGYVSAESTYQSTMKTRRKFHEQNV